MHLGRLPRPFANSTTTYKGSDWGEYRGGHSNYHHTKTLRSFLTFIFRTCQYFRQKKKKIWTYIGYLFFWSLSVTNFYNLLTEQEDEELEELLVHFFFQTLCNEDAHNFFLIIPAIVIFFQTFTIFFQSSLYLELQREIDRETNRQTDRQSTTRHLATFNSLQKSSEHTSSFSGTRVGGFYRPWKPQPCRSRR